MCKKVDCVPVVICKCQFHYTDTGYGHVVQHYQRTSSQQFYNLLYNKFTTNGQKFATSQNRDVSRCWALALRRGKFVVQQVVEYCCELVRWRCCTTPSVRVVEFGTNKVLLGAWPADMTNWSTLPHAEPEHLLPALYCRAVKMSDYGLCAKTTR